MSCKHIRFNGKYTDYGWEFGIGTYEEIVEFFKGVLDGSYQDYIKHKNYMEEHNQFDNIDYHNLNTLFPFEMNLVDFLQIESKYQEFSYCPICGEKLEKGLLKKIVETEIESYRQTFERVVPIKRNIKTTNRKCDGVGYVYLIKMDSHYKIGISKNPKRRLKAFSTMPQQLEVILTAKVNDYARIEEELHEKYKEKRVRGEWFELDDLEVKEITDYLTSIQVDI
jgi:hypothetical protein